MSPSAACRLVPVQRLLESGSYEEARSALDRFVAAGTISDEERFIAAGLQYRIAMAAGDSTDREEALRAMLATAAMPPQQRLAALRTLVSLALQRRDAAAAAVLLQELLVVAPEDTRSLINLASLRAEAGRRAEAASLVQAAIAIARRRGEAVPAEWLSFASSD